MADFDADTAQTIYDSSGAHQAAAAAPVEKPVAAKEEAAEEPVVVEEAKVSDKTA